MAAATLETLAGFLLLPGFPMCRQHKALHVATRAPSQCAHLQRLSGPHLQVKDSYVAGKGVFARKDIPKGMRIGAYPGRPRSVPQILIKAETAPAAKGFVFHTSTGEPAWAVDDLAAA